MMRKIFRIPLLFIVFIPFLLLINCNSGNKVKTVKERLIKIASDYAEKQLSNPEVKTLQDSTIMVGDTSKRYFIQPSAVFTGLIDEDDKLDGIVSITSMAKWGGALKEHLVILNTNGKYLLVKSVESDMKILSVRDRIITAEIPTHPVNNPLHDCPVCTVVERFRFENGELIKLK